MRAQGALRIISQRNRTAANRLSGSNVSISRFCGRSSRLSGGCVLKCLVIFGCTDERSDKAEILHTVEGAQTVTAHAAEERGTGHGTLTAERHNGEHRNARNQQGKQNQKKVHVNLISCRTVNP